MSFDLKWQKLRVDAKNRLAFDQTVDEFNQKFNSKFRVITHPFGKIIACSTEGLWFFRVGDGGRPAQIWTLALITGTNQHPLFPSQREWDFDECCNHLGYQTKEDRSQLRRFICPNSGQAAAPTTQGLGAT